MTEFRMVSPYVGNLRDTAQIWENRLIFKHFLKVDVRHPALKFEKLVLDTLHMGILAQMAYMWGLTEFSYHQVSGN